jgi:TRAP-type C4-dicarboxylate transport system substrate-binding protein
MRPTSKFASATAVLAAALMGACGGGGGDADKAGGAGGVTTLEVGTPDRAHRPGSDALKRIAAEVERRSDGRLRLRIVHESQTRVGDRNAADGDQAVAKQAQRGDVDLAMVPARAWDRLGVKSFQALQAPFLIDTDDRLGQVVDGEIGDEMLAGVAKAGVVGVGLHAEALRHPLGYDGRRLVSLADFEGKELETRDSGASHALVRALGSTPVWYPDAQEEELEDAVASGTLVGAESSYALANTFGVDAPTVTGNVTLFPKVNVLVANEQAFGRLSDEHKTILRDAAAAERSRSVDELSEIYAATEACENGISTVNAKPADVEAMRAAARPVATELRADEQTARLMDAIGAIDSAPATDPAACVGVKLPDVSNQKVMRGPTGDLPLGTYRMRLTDQDLRGRGLTENLILYNAGLYTMRTKKDGTWRVTQRPAHDIDTPTEWGGDFSVVGDRVTTTVTSDLEEAHGFRDTYRWRFADGELILKNIRSNVVEPDWNRLGGAWYIGIRWRKIG